MVWMCGKKEGMENEIQSTSKRCLYYPLFTGGKTEVEKRFTHIPLSLVIVRAKNYYLPVLNINHKTTPLYYYAVICFTMFSVLRTRMICINMLKHTMIQMPTAVMLKDVVLLHGLHEL